MVVPDQLYSLEVYYYNNSHGFYTGSFGSGLIHNIGINYSCSASQPTSTKFTPAGIYFNSPGNYSITLSIKFPDGFTCSTKQQVVVSSSSAPDIAFTEVNNCVNNGVFFSSQNLSQDIISYSWDFGDGGIQPQITRLIPNSNAGIYSVRLLVTASNSCQNFVQKDVQIFNQPQANFTLPASSPICTNQIICLLILQLLIADQAQHGNGILMVLI